MMKNSSEKTAATGMTLAGTTTALVLAENAVTVQTPFLQAVLAGAAIVMGCSMMVAGFGLYMKAKMA